MRTVPALRARASATRLMSIFSHQHHGQTPYSAERQIWANTVR
ncbi:hypothetical protein HMPREF0742_02729 [Rothia aeria F0184]|uniref:Uncharacterized protein n=1 Tax=Rothia aeria F0184 TaxID=888019 RepID=U7UVU6_9MICC|nr:hypothetical protein HMPREF0742_02729 [Rothia aeria F0184]